MYKTTSHFTVLQIPNYLEYWIIFHPDSSISRFPQNTSLSVCSATHIGSISNSKFAVARAQQTLIWCCITFHHIKFITHLRLLCNHNHLVPSTSLRRNRDRHYYNHYLFITISWIPQIQNHIGPWTDDFIHTKQKY